MTSSAFVPTDSGGIKEEPLVHLSLPSVKTQSLLTLLVLTALTVELRLWLSYSPTDVV